MAPSGFVWGVPAADKLVCIRMAIFGANTLVTPYPSRRLVASSKIVEIRFPDLCISLLEKTYLDVQPMSGW